MDPTDISLSSVQGIDSADGRLITAAQRRYWSENGYLVLNDAFQAASVVTAALGRSDRSARHELAGHLASSRLLTVVESLLGGQVVILTSRHFLEPSLELFGRDLWKMPGIQADDVMVACIGLTRDGQNVSTHLVAGSHRAAATGEHDTDPTAGSDRALIALTRQRATPEALSLRPGDIWLRHSRLMHGRVEPQSSHVGQRLEIAFVKKGGLPAYLSPMFSSPRPMMPSSTVMVSDAEVLEGGQSGSKGSSRVKKTGFGITSSRRRLERDLVGSQRTPPKIGPGQYR